MKLTLWKTTSKRQMTEHAGLSFTSNYALNKLLDKLPTTGPRWRCIERTITGNITGTNGKLLKEDVKIWVRDILDVIRELLGNVTYGKQLVFVPGRVYLNENGTEQRIDKMWTADWWNNIQVSEHNAEMQAKILTFCVGKTSSWGYRHPNYTILRRYTTHSLFGRKVSLASIYFDW
jgi:hypothetical protein